MKDIAAANHPDRDSAAFLLRRLPPRGRAVARRASPTSNAPLDAGKRPRLERAEPRPQLPTAGLGFAAGAPVESVAFRGAMARLARGRARAR